jgi:hypothetical protein
MSFKATLAAGAAFLATAAVIVPSAPTRALSGTAQEQAACRPDVTRHCKGVQGDDENAFLSCLVSHAPQLSQRCRKVLEAHGKLPPR